MNMSSIHQAIPIVFRMCFLPTVAFVVSRVIMKEKVVLSSIILLHGYVHFVGFSTMMSKTVSTKMSTYMILISQINLQHDPLDPAHHFLLPCPHPDL